MEETRRVHVCVAGLVEFQVQSAKYVDAVDLERRTCIIVNERFWASHAVMHWHQ